MGEARGSGIIVLSSQDVLDLVQNSVSSAIVLDI